MSVVIAIGILILVMTLFITELLPLPVTAVIGALAMAITGIISYEEAFAGFGSDVLMMVVGMLIIGKALVDSGLVAKIGSLCMALTAKSRRISVGILASTAGALSAFMSNTAISASFLALADSLSIQPRSSVTRRGSYMVIGALAVLGGNLTLVGSTPQLIAQGLLESSGLPVLGFWTLFKGGILMFAVGLAYYLLFGIDFLERRSGGSPKTLRRESKQENEPSTRKIVITSSVFILCIVGFMTGIFTVGVVSIAGAIILIVTKCVEFNELGRDIDWSPVVILGGSLGFSKGLEASGAGELLAQSIIDLFGGIAAEPLIIYAALVVITALLSNFMSNTAVVAMIAPMGIFLANAMGFSVVTMIVGIVLAASICMATPIGSPPMTLTASVGYRFKEYLLVGTPLCILLLAVVVVGVPLLYGV